MRSRRPSSSTACLSRPRRRSPNRPKRRRIWIVEFARTLSTGKSASPARSPLSRTTPARSGPSGDARSRSLPSHVARPAAGSAPASARRNWSCPFPSAPAMPTISPAATDRSIGPKRSPCSPSVASTTSLGDAAPGRSGNASWSGRPIMSVTRDSSDIADASNVPWPTPSRRTVIRSAMSSTSGSRWLTYAMPTPVRLCSNTSWWSRSTSAGPERRRRLVEQQHARPAEQRLDDLEQLPLGERERRRRRVRGQVELERRELLRGPALHPAERRPAGAVHREKEILRDAQPLDVRVRLVDHAETEPPRLGGRRAAKPAAADLDRPRVRRGRSRSRSRGASTSPSRSPRRVRGSPLRGSRSRHLEALAPLQTPSTRRAGTARPSPRAGVPTSVASAPSIHPLSYGYIRCSRLAGTSDVAEPDGG